MRSHRTLVIAVSAVVVMSIGVGVALARTRQWPSSTRSPNLSSQRTAFETDVANRLRISRAKLDAALEAGALADVAFAEDNGFISKTEANLMRRAIHSGSGKGGGPFGFEGHLGFGVGLGGFPLVGPPNFEGGLFLGPFGAGSDPLAAAAKYLGLSESDLMRSLRSKTLAQAANDRDKSVAGLERVLRTAAKAGLDRLLSEGVITEDQENALLGRFDPEVADLVNGIPPAVTDLASRLGIDRAKVIAAVKGTASDRVEAARARGLLTRAQADAIKERIRTGPGVPFGGIGLICAGPPGPRTGLPFPGRHLGRRAFDHRPPLAWADFR
jgi:hypothetical protein